MDESEQLRAWLSPAEYATGPLLDLIACRHEGTSEWFFASPEYCVWRDGPKCRTLTIHGPAGAGKSVLAAGIANNLAWSMSPHEGTAVAYLHCDSGRHGGDNIIALTRCLVGQLLDRRFIAKQVESGGQRPLRAGKLPRAIKNAYTRSRESNLPRPSFDEALHGLDCLLRRYTRTYIVVDALDECNMADTQKQKFLKALLERQKERRSLRILLTSSAEKNSLSETLSSKKNSCTSFQPSDADIRQFLFDSLTSAVRDKHLPDFTVEDAVNEGVVFSKNNFLLAHLYLSIKIDAGQPHHIMSSFTRVVMETDDIQEAFDVCYDYCFTAARGRVDRRSSKTVTLGPASIALLALMNRNATREEFKDGVGMLMRDQDPENKHLMETLDWDGLDFATCGLVRNPSHEKVQLVHKTAKSYFIDNLEPSFRGLLAKCFLKYLLSDEFVASTKSTPDTTNEPGHPEQEEQPPPPHNSMRDYIVHNWGHHYLTCTSQDSLPAGLRDELRALALGFLTDYPAVATAVQVMQARHPKLPATGLSNGHCGLHLCAFIGLEDLATELLAQGHDPNNLDGAFGTPLMIAARGGHLGMFHLLLDRGGADPSIRTPLTSETALMEASRFGRGAAPEIAALLAHHLGPACLAEQDDQGMNPLHIASAAGDAEMVRTLLDLGASPNVPDGTKSRWTPLIYALQTGGVCAVGSLLAARADPNYVDGLGASPLHYAALRWDSALAARLLDAGAHVNSVELAEGNTAVHIAVAERNVATAEVLIEHDADINIPDGRGRAVRDDLPAVAEKRAKALEILRGFEGAVTAWGSGVEAELTRRSGKKGAEGEDGDDDILGEGPPIGDISDPWARVAERRKSRESETEQIAVAILTADLAQWALEMVFLVLCEKGFVRLVQGMLQAYNLNMTDVRPGTEGDTPLTLAIKNGRTEVVRVLLGDERIDPNLPDGEGATPLKLAGGPGRKEIEDLLLRNERVKLH